MSIRRSFLSISFATFSALLINITAISADEDYANGFPSDPGFFPIAVWDQSPERASEYQSIGINTYVGLWQGPTEDQLATLLKYNMFAVVSQNAVGLHSPNRGIIKGWLHDDEPDNAQPIGFGFHLTCIPATEIVRRAQEMRAHDNTRPIVINFGQGIANKFWRGRGLCNGDENYYSVAARGADVLSFDIYPVSSSIPQIKGKLEYIGRGVTRLISLAVDDQRVWAVIEAADAVTPAQLRAEVWMAIIHGAQGIVYFVHEFGPTFREDGIFRHPELVKQAANENSLIKSLATVLNTPNWGSTVTIQSSTPISTMIKRYQNTVYIFAIAMTNSSSRSRFMVEGVNGPRAFVVGENRDVPITGGIFEDSFDGYGVHIYQIPLTSAGN